MAKSSSNKSVVPEAREALNKFKMEAASDEGVQNPLNTIEKSYFTSFPRFFKKCNACVQ